jgi:GNAT superfamily N-acetyltransferase
MDELTIETNPRPEDCQYVEDQINQHNLARTQRLDFGELAIFVRDGNGEIVAGLKSFTWAGWLEVELLWVHEDRRGMGLGTRLLTTAEQEARRRGCQRVWLDSYSFQAPEFYKKLGYEVFGMLEGFPEGHNRYFLTKRLD